jgi:hypothetical protein
MVHLPLCDGYMQVTGALLKPMSASASHLHYLAGNWP